MCECVQCTGERPKPSQMVLKAEGIFNNRNKDYNKECVEYYRGYKIKVFSIWKVYYKHGNYYDTFKTESIVKALADMKEHGIVEKRYVLIKKTWYRKLLRPNMFEDVLLEAIFDLDSMKNLISEAKKRIDKELGKGLVDDKYCGGFEG